jgi:hypothetical protein
VGRLISFHSNKVAMINTRNKPLDKMKKHLTPDSESPLLSSSKKLNATQHELNLKKKQRLPPFPLRRLLMEHYACTIHLNGTWYKHILLYHKYNMPVPFQFKFEWYIRITYDCTLYHSNLNVLQAYVHYA